MLKLYLITFI